MLKAGTRDEFVIVDCQPSDDFFWASHLKYNMGQWCDFCGKTLEDMTQNWTDEQKRVFEQKANSKNVV